MYKKILTQEPLTLVTLDEVKKQCRVFTNFEDDYLESLIVPYCDLAQSYTNRMLTKGEAVVVVETPSSAVLLPFGEVTAVTKVELDGVEVTDFTFEPVTQKVKISSSYSEAKIYFDAGYTAVPAIIKQAILVMISTAFNNRDDIIVGQSLDKIPRAAEELLNRVKFYGS